MKPNHRDVQEKARPCVGFHATSGSIHPPGFGTNALRIRGDGCTVSICGSSVVTLFAKYVYLQSCCRAEPVNSCVHNACFVLGGALPWLPQSLTWQGCKARAAKGKVSGPFPQLVSQRCRQQLHRGKRSLRTPPGSCPSVLPRTTGVR